MAESSLLWDSGGGGDASPHSESVTAAFFNAVMGGTAANAGVLPGRLNELEPTVTGGNTTVTVDTGWGICDGHPYLRDASAAVTPTTPAVGTTGRRLVLRADWSAQTVRLTEISSADGTAAIPAMTQTSGTTYDIPICQYTVTTGGVVGAFQDDRVWAGAGGHPQKVVKWSEATQAFTTDTTFADLVAAHNPDEPTLTMSFPIGANEVWRARFSIQVNAFSASGTGGLKLQITGPGSPTAVAIKGTAVRFQSVSGTAAPEHIPVTTAFSTAFANANSSNGFSAGLYNETTGSHIDLDVLIVNGTNAGTVALQGAQNSANGTTTFGIGSVMVAERLL